MPIKLTRLSATTFAMALSLGACAGGSKEAAEPQPPVAEEPAPPEQPAEPTAEEPATPDEPATPEEPVVEEKDPPPSRPGCGHK